MEITIETLKKMKLHEKITIDEAFQSLEITRVYLGWIYRPFSHKENDYVGSGVFVPEYISAEIEGAVLTYSTSITEG